MDELFDNDYFIIIGTINDKDSLIDTIDECGGIYSKTLNKKTTLVICNDIDDENNKKELERVKSDTIKVVTESFVKESVKEKKRLNIDDFITKSSSGKGNNSGSSSGGGGDGNDDTDEQPSKKIKLDLLQPGSLWIGALFYPNTSDSYPLYFKIDTREEDNNNGCSKLEGTIEWPTLEDAKTAFRATLKDDELKIEEHTQITNTDQVSLPNNYEAKVINSGTKPSIKGSIVYSDPADIANPDLKANFNLTLKPITTSSNNIAQTASVPPTPVVTAAPPPLELSYLVAGNQFNGDFEIPYNFNLKITGRKNQQDVEGIVDWVDLQTKTKLKGTLSEKDNSISFSEYEIISGDAVEVPINYIGKLTSSSNPNSTDPKDLDLMIGTYKTEGATTSSGKFKLELNC